jgi:metal-responsive CopG/Arc/MetJ family transcriptional regulator
MKVNKALEGDMLKVVQITLPEALLARIDRAAANLKTSRSGFARQAFEDALFQLDLAEMERRDAEAYAQHPHDPEEVTAWQNIQGWGDA